VLVNQHRLNARQGVAVEHLLQAGRLDIRGFQALLPSAARRTLQRDLAKTRARVPQIEFVNLIVNHLTEQGVMSASLLYESPFTDLAPTGPDGLFSAPHLEQSLAALSQIEASAVAR
jgi:type I restriction enzyme R subunit